MTLADAVSNMLATIADVTENLRDTDDSELADLLDEAAAKLEEAWDS